MGDINVDDFINRYPLNLFHTTERVIEDRNLKMKVGEFHYETPTINFNSCLNKKKKIKYCLEKYLANIERLTANYIYTNYPYTMFNYTSDTTDTCEIYIQRVHEGIEKKPKKILSMQNGDGEPTYFIKGITPKLFRSPFKIRAKTYIYILYR